ncbi:uncharacterized protein LOC120076127 [Benincasa hispida]|uniref:uncharacterized protein LOC120076127 n=1 Tax=Benincasa hispida TaxID=102211 RepID=UPI001901B078|nr:uncharacterized protein LOC120076127 [Benincasa hispida]
MAYHGTILRHLVSVREIEVDKAKIDVIANLPYPTCVREIRKFLGSAGFYRRFIKDFSKLAVPPSTLLQKDVPFDFDKKCQEAFDTLKEKLTTTPILQPQRWDVPFEIMCNASNLAVGTVPDDQKEVKALTCVLDAHSLGIQFDYQGQEGSRKLDCHNHSMVNFLVTGKFPFDMPNSKKAKLKSNSNLVRDVRDQALEERVAIKFYPFDYVSKWVEAIPTRTNIVVVVSGFLRANIFSRFGIPRAIISDQGEDQQKHLKNFQIVCDGMLQYGVTEEQINLRGVPPFIEDEAKD